MLDSKILDTVEKISRKIGFTKVYRPLSPGAQELQGFTWTPDIYAVNNTKAIAFLIRENVDVKEFFIQRIALTKSKLNHLNIFVLFLEKPKSSTIKMILRYHVGVALLGKYKINILGQSRNFSSRIKVAAASKKFRKPRQIVIYPSSIQEDLEREHVSKAANDLAGTMHVPIFVYLLENERGRGISGLYKDIDEKVPNSDIFIAIIKKEYSEAVEYEINTALSCLKTNQIIILVENVDESTRHEKLTKLVDEIKSRRDLKYLQYNDIFQFDVLVKREVYLEINSLSKKEKWNLMF